MAERPFAEYADRNAQPILEVLRGEFATVSSVFEIGSGTGQHAATFASALPHLSWQTSDLEEHHDGIRAWVEWVQLENLRPPLLVDVRDFVRDTLAVDAVYTSNTAHIMGFAAVRKMFGIVGELLTDGGVFVIYGPFKLNGEFNTASNAAFDDSLRNRNAEMGIRDLGDLDELAILHGMRREKLYAMPANNQIAVWKRTPR